MKEVATVLGEKCEFEDIEAIKTRFGLEVGGVPPFGQLLNLETWFDERVFQNPRVAFNCGMPTESLVMSSGDLKKLTDAKIGHFAKE
jgi:nondiscriminating aspartyl-tRNA synthetase